MMEKKPAYCCPVAACARAPLAERPDAMVCPNGHSYPFAPSTKVPVFDRIPEDANEYAHVLAAEKHDNALRWVFATFRSDEPTLRENLVRRLRLKNGDRVLITGAGTGNDLPYIARQLMGDGEIYAQDIAQQMLLTGVKRYQAEVAATGVAVHFSVSDATNLPFSDAHFDAAYHFGGINLFTDIGRGIAEMNRVVKPGGRVVIGDEGIAPWLQDTELGRMLIHNNALYGFKVPLEFLPETVRDPCLTWELINTFFVIEFSACTEPLPVDIDVPHVGLRGGSIRKRYFGQLEGVDPQLRDRVYAEAERLGMSRVDYIESLFRGALPQSGQAKGK